MAILLIALAMAGMIFTGAVMISSGDRPAYPMTTEQRSEWAQARQFATYARAALNYYTNGGSTPPAPCYSPATMGMPAALVVPPTWGCLITQYNQQTLFWVYGGLTGPTLAYLLKEPHGQTFGVNSGGTLSFPGGGASSVPVPGAIANGDVASLTATANPPFNWAGINGDTASGSFVFSGSSFSGVYCGPCCTQNGYLSGDVSGTVTTGAPYITTQIVETTVNCTISYSGSTVCQPPVNTVISSASSNWGATATGSDPTETVYLTGIGEPYGLYADGYQTAGASQTATAPWL